MQELMTFLSNHALLSGALIIVFILLIIIELIRAKRNTSRITPAKATQLINRENAIILDVRPKDAYRSGHIIDSNAFSAQDIRDNAKKLEKFKTKPIIIIDNNGIESQKLAALLMKRGYNAYALSGGIRTWTEAGMPLVKEQK